MNKLITEYILPTRIFATSGVVENAENLLVGKDYQVGLLEDKTCVVKGKGFIVLDFGKEYSGGARIITFTTSAPTVKVRLRFGESVSETYAQIGQKGACNDHSLRDYETLLTSFSDMTFAQTGFRFLRIDFLEDQTVALKSVYCAYTHRQFSTHKPFKSSDERINDIFFTAKRTVEMCCQSYLWDGIKRDRLVWIGDIHPEMLALTALYGKTEMVEDALRLTAKQYPLGTWQNTMPLYSAWWVIILADYCSIIGDYSLAKELADYTVGVLEQCSGCVKDNGELDFPGYFVDWQTHDKPDEQAGCRAILTMMANKAISLLEKLSISVTVAKDLLDKLNQKPILVESAKQVVALKYFATGKISSEDIELMVNGRAKGFSTFMSYYLLKTLAQNYSVDYAISVMKEYYGAMLDKGATTFFEDFNMDWVENTGRIDALPGPNELDLHGDFGDYCYQGFRHSLCHGWSAGVIKFLYEYCNLGD